MTINKDNSIPKEHVFIKIASTWEGTQITREVERATATSSYTLLFGSGQTFACAEASAILISPFVDRTLDWGKARPETKDRHFIGEKPGTQSVQKIINDYHQLGYRATFMGAFFKTGEIIALGGVDYFTTSPKLLKELRNY